MSIKIDKKRIQELSSYISRLKPTIERKKPIVSPYTVKQSGPLTLKDMSNAVKAISQYAKPAVEEKPKIDTSKFVEVKPEPKVPEVSNLISRSELRNLIQSLIIQPKDGKTPTRDEIISIIRDYIVQPRDGIDGKDGETPTEEELLSLILPLIPKVKDGKTPIAGVDFKVPDPETPQGIVDKINTLKNAIDPSTIKDYKASTPLSDIIPAVIKELKTGKNRLAAKDITDLPLKQFNMNDQRWHGGGLSTVIHDTTLTGDGTTASPLSVVPSGSTGYQQIISGIVDGSNRVFGFTSAPNAIVVDGVSMQKTAVDGTVNWTGTTTITLTVAPNFDIYAVA